MKKIICIVVSLLFFTNIAHSLSGKVYLERFMTYLRWSQDLPTQPDAKFLAFIDSDTPLSRKLRGKWLYKLALQGDWASYSKYYKNSNDISLQCYQQIANFHQGKTQEALETAKKLWLSGDSLPPACNKLFDFLTTSSAFSEQLITKRVILALDNRNLALVNYLLRQYKRPRLNDERLLTTIHQNPSRITQLKNDELYNYFYLYGLKRMVSLNMDQAIKYWQLPQTQRRLTEAQKQAFITHIALYKAMRNNEDTEHWFAQIKPGYYNDTLLDWQIRFALKRHHWKQLEQLLNQSKDKETPCWQYWLARSLEAQGQKARATVIYQSVAKNRNYYGFLASLRLKKKLNFENEPPINNMAILKPYQPFTDTIQSLYNSDQQQAAKLLNDFASELPKNDKSALVYWVANHLQWHGQSVYLSNNDDLNNQLSLRFPLPYRSTISQYSKNYNIPQEFIYAIIRQESAFRDKVVSSVGARGLMQVMPTTAKKVAQSEKIAYNNQNQLFLSQKNMNIGIAYLKDLAKHFDRHPVLMAAAYNAGPKQVNFWLKNTPPSQIDIWIETLPWHETRNYLKNIIAFFAVYQYRLQEKTNLQAFMKPLAQYTSRN